MVSIQSSPPPTPPLSACWSAVDRLSVGRSGNEARASTSCTCIVNQLGLGRAGRPLFRFFFFQVKMNSCWLFTLEPYLESSHYALLVCTIRRSTSPSLHGNLGPLGSTRTPRAAGATLAAPYASRAWPTTRRLLLFRPSLWLRALCQSQPRYRPRPQRRIAHTGAQSPNLSLSPLLGVGPGFLPVVASYRRPGRTNCAMRNPRRRTATEPPLPSKTGPRRNGSTRLGTRTRRAASSSAGILRTTIRKRARAEDLMAWSYPRRRAARGCRQLATRPCVSRSSTPCQVAARNCVGRLYGCIRSVTRQPLRRPGPVRRTSYGQNTGNEGTRKGHLKPDRNLASYGDPTDKEPALRTRNRVQTSHGHART